MHHCASRKNVREIEVDLGQSYNRTCRHQKEAPYYTICISNPTWGRRFWLLFVSLDHKNPGYVRLLKLKVDTWASGNALLYTLPEIYMEISVLQLSPLQWRIQWTWNPMHRLHCPSASSQRTSLLPNSMLSVSMDQSLSDYPLVRGWSL